MTFSRIAFSEAAAVAPVRRLGFVYIPMGCNWFQFFPAAVGNITEADQVNAIIAAGRADLCALARPHLIDPNWTLHAAAQLGYTDQHWPKQYLTGKQQLERALQRAKESKA